MPFISLLLGNWKPLLITAAALAVMGIAIAHFSYVNRLEKQNVVLTAEHVEDLKINAAMKADFDRAQAQWKSAQNIAAAAQAEAARKAATYKELLDAISHAPASDDGPVAPVLSRAIAGVYAQ